MSDIQIDLSFGCPNGLLCSLWDTARKKHSASTKHFLELTWNYPLRIKRVERVVHKHPSSCGLVPSQFVLHDQSIVAVVDVGGLVEEETAVFHWSVAWVRDELRVCVGALLEFFAIVLPGDGWFRVAIHSEGETPVVLRHSVPQEEDFDWNCWEMRDVWLE